MAIVGHASTDHEEPPPRSLFELEDSRHRIDPLDTMWESSPYRHPSGCQSPQATGRLPNAVHQQAAQTNAIHVDKLISRTGIICLCYLLFAPNEISCSIQLLPTKVNYESSRMAIAALSRSLKYPRGSSFSRSSRRKASNGEIWTLDGFNNPSSSQSINS